MSRARLCLPSVGFDAIISAFYYSPKSSYPEFIDA